MQNASLPQHQGSIGRLTPAIRPVVVACALSLMIATSVLVSTVSRADVTVCSNDELVAVRGTREPGWLGSEVGDPLYAAIQVRAQAPVAAYSVRYPADLLDPSSVDRGTADLVEHLNTQAEQCPDQNFLIEGYSQGAAVVHAALSADPASMIPGTAHLSPWIYPRIKVVLLFGDPLRLIGSGSLPGPWSVGSWCTDGDPVCQPGGLKALAHVSYSDTIAAAAQLAANSL